MGRAGKHLPHFYHLHPYPPSLGHMFPSHLWEYPGLYDLLDTPRSVFLATQLHLCDSTFPRHLLPRSRGPPTLQCECVALQPHLAPPTPPDHLYVCGVTRPSITTSVCCATSPSIFPSDPSVSQSSCPYVELSVRHTDTSICHITSPSVCQLTCTSVALSVRDTASPSVIPVHPSYDQSIQHTINSSLACLSITPPISPAICLSDRPSLPDCLYAILPCLSGCPSLSDHSSTINTSLSDHLLLPDHLYDKTTESVRPSVTAQPSA